MLLLEARIHGNALTLFCLVFGRNTGHSGSQKCIIILLCYYQMPGDSQGNCSLLAGSSNPCLWVETPCSLPGLSSQPSQQHLGSHHSETSESYFLDWSLKPLVFTPQAELMFTNIFGEMNQEKPVLQHLFFLIVTFHLYHIGLGKVWTLLAKRHSSPMHGMNTSNTCLIRC